MKDLKLNLTKEEITRRLTFALTRGSNSSGAKSAVDLFSDWLAMHAELGVQAELIEDLALALRNESENTTTRKLTIIKAALSAVEEWRKK